MIALATFAGRATAGEAGAQLPDADVVEARDAFRRGSALAKSGDWEAALVAFERSAHLKPHPVTTYDIAYCERALGHYARASFRFAEALAARSNGTAALPADLEHDATGYLEEVRHRVVKVLVARKPEDTTSEWTEVGSSAWSRPSIPSTPSLPTPPPSNDRRRV